MSRSRVSSFEEAVREFEKNPGKYRRSFGKAFPLFKRVLLDEREEHMAKRIREIMERFDEVAVVTGAGHVVGLKKLLANFDIESFSLTGLLS